MRIVYLILENLSGHPGLEYKISGQIKCWAKQGHEVYQVLLSKGVVLGPDGSVVSKIAMPSACYGGKLSLLRELSFKYRFAEQALRSIKPDLTYSRFLFPAPNVTRIKAHAGKLVFEINSDDRSEYLQKNKLTGLYNAIFRRSSLVGADALVFVTNELASSKSFSGFSSYRTVIANGVNVADFDFSCKTENSNPQLVFIGSPGQGWHGLDKIRLLSEVLSDCTLHMVGPDMESCKVIWGYLPKNIIFHGYLSGEDAKSLVKKMDVGIGTLALHRKDMDEACPLKVRQYLAQGLPVIAASDDTDISSERQFYLKLPNTESNIYDSYKVIKDYVKSVFDKEDLRLEARAFAEDVLSFDKKEDVRLRFFEMVVSS